MSGQGGRRHSGIRDIIVVPTLSPASPTVRPHYVLHYDYVADVASRRGPHREAHLRLAARYKGEGRVVMGGALGDLSGATIVFRREEDALSFVQEDPYVQHGLVTAHRVTEWSVVV